MAKESEASKPSTKPPYYVLKTLLSGALAGATAKTAIAPFDRVKLHFQVRNPEFSSFTGTYTGIFKAIRNVYIKDGIFGLYRGHLATILRIMPYAAINFTTYEHLKRYFKIDKQSEKQHPLLRILSGSLSGCVAVSLTYPFDILRARIAYSTLVANKHQRQLPKFGSTYKEAFQHLCLEGQKNHGHRIVGFYQGYVPTILGIIPYAGTSFFTFESLKDLYREKYGLEDSAHMPAGPKFLCGMLAGMAAQTAAYPFEVIRRRSQLWKIAGHLPPSDTFTVRRTFDLIRDVVKTRGVRDLFVGISINYFKVAPAMGISFLIYEFCKEQVFKIS